MKSHSDPGADVTREQREAENRIQNENAIQQFKRDMRNLSIIEPATKQVNIDKKDSRGRTPLLNASSIGDIKLVKDLIKRGASVNEPKYNGVTPLIAGAGSNHYLVVIELLNAKADPDLVTRNGQTATCLAAQNESVEVVELLLKYTKNIDGIDGCRPLYETAKGSGNISIAKALLLAGANPNQMDSTRNYYTSAQQPPLGAALSNRHLELVSLLLKSGANSTFLSSEVLMKFMLELSNDVSVEFIKYYSGKHGKSALNLSAKELKKELNLYKPKVYRAISELLNNYLINGGNPNISSSTGVSPLMLASYSGMTTLTERLIKAGANLNDTNPLGDTALHYTYHSGASPDARFSEEILLRYGASQNIRNNNGVMVTGLRESRLKEKQRKEYLSRKERENSVDWVKAYGVVNQVLGDTSQRLEAENQQLFREMAARPSTQKSTTNYSTNNYQSSLNSSAAPSRTRLENSNSASYQAVSPAKKPKKKRKHQRLWDTHDRGVEVTAADFSAWHSKNAAIDLFETQGRNKLRRDCASSGYDSYQIGTEGYYKMKCVAGGSRGKEFKCSGVTRGVCYLYGNPDDISGTWLNGIGATVNEPPGSTFEKLK